MSHGRMGREGSVTRRRVGGLRGEGLGIEKFGICSEGFGECVAATGEAS